MVCEGGFLMSKAYSGTECAGDPIRTDAFKCVRGDSTPVWSSTVCNPSIEGYTQVPMESYTTDDCTDTPAKSIAAFKLDSCEKGGDFNDGKWIDEYSMATREGNTLILKTFTSSKCD